MDLETIFKAIFHRLLKTSTEKLIITHAMHQQHWEKGRLKDSEAQWKMRQQKRDKRKERERKTTAGYGLPGTDDQFILAWVKGQLWVIHRALCFELGDPRLHLCQRYHKTQTFMTADDSGADELWVQTAADTFHKEADRQQEQEWNKAGTIPLLSVFIVSVKL